MSLLQTKTQALKADPVESLLAQTFGSVSGRKLGSMLVELEDQGESLLVIPAPFYLKPVSAPKNPIDHIVNMFGKTPVAPQRISSGQIKESAALEEFMRVVKQVVPEAECNSAYHDTGSESRIYVHLVNNGPLANPEPAMWR